MFHVIAALAEFEPDSSNERTQAGFEAACASSRTGCTGYLDHPFKNEPFESEKDLLSLIANSRRSVYNQTSLTASSCLNNAIFT